MSEKRVTTQEVLDAIARERRRLIEAIAALGPGAMTVPVNDGGWTAKDVLAHLIHWAGQIAWALGAPLHAPAYLEGVSGKPSGDDAWNALAVAHYRDLSLERVRGEFDFVVDALIAQIRKRTNEQMNASDQIPWAGARPLWQQIGSETFEHWPAHAQDIERAASPERVADRSRG